MHGWKTRGFSPSLKLDNHPSSLHTGEMQVTEIIGKMTIMLSFASQFIKYELSFYLINVLRNCRSDFHQGRRHPEKYVHVFQRQFYVKP
jgi:hypothetical protein